MDFFDVLLQAGLVTTAVVAYLILFRRSTPTKFKGKYRVPAWNYPFRLISARFAVRKWKSSRWIKSDPEETPYTDQTEGWDCITVRASAPNGSSVLLSIRKLCNGQPLAEVTVHVKLSDGTTYKLPQHPDTAVGPWESIADGWSAGGLKIQVLEPKSRLRILYNGLLTRVGDNTTQHIRFNFIWTSGSSVVRYPEDWSDSLAAQALALEPWRGDQWPYTLGKWEDGSWMQWGTVQGRFTAYDSQAGIDISEYLETRGVRERSWSPLGYQGLKRTVTVTVVAKDGTAVQLRGFSYKDVLTLGYSGSARFPDCTVTSITGTNLVMADFCEDPDGIPAVYSFNVSTKNRDLKLVLRTNTDGGRLLSGVPYQQEFFYRTVTAEINGEIGTGFLELGYETSVKLKPSIRVFPSRSLRWLSEKDAGEVGYCLSFDNRAAACPDYVGGKGASLALLASVQREQGYRVPPGFCLTVQALEKQLKENPNLLEAIKELEAANENYDEKNFREKCNRVAELFASTAIAEEVKDEILYHLNDLRNKVVEQNLGPDLRFAVRSSAVGEDSEALSAAGQNETILGCASDDDVIRGVQKCWGSMFAFTSAHYRRQNGQPCMCGGGVVVQALVSPRAAGVMFTRHPDLGDPTRLLITANYGLGESVVSGSVEPDTIIISRGTAELTISKIELGSKKHRIISAEKGGVSSEEVPEGERAAACLTEAEALRLAKIGVTQDGLWGAGRDIEWAIVGDEIFLLQARPITSLERWSEEELLHELDFPIMSDDELTTFANTGEVLPKPMTALSHDLVYEPLWRGINNVMYGVNGDGYDKSAVVTHNRVALALYNSIYRRVPKQIDVTIRMIEMAVHGHKVADDNIISTALHRRPYSAIAAARMMLKTLQYILTSGTSMTETIKIVNKMHIEESKDPLKIVDELINSSVEMYKCSNNHSNTTSACASSQFIAMMVLLEGASDFTPEQCGEINTLLNSGGVLSAEVPEALDKFARVIEASGKGDVFRAQDPKFAMSWLSLHLPKVHQDVCDFLDHHGHRAVMEFDLSTKPWVLVPEEMMKVLQNTRPSKEENRVSKTDSEIIAFLKTPKKSSTRKILRCLLALCRRTVRHREHTKAHLILAVHKLRMGVRCLGQQLVRQWYLPDEDLIFHFRANELKDYILNRDPALLKKAAQRRQYYPSWCKLKFAELNFGWVKPLQSRGPLVTADDVRLEGTPVCAGEVVARACVVKDLSEIGQLQQGDVLITNSTDIGWSPYFPLLAGIVTELGGIISHGAVIAREYGLPCLVGAMDATDIFKTGDIVRLSGSNGTIERVKITDESNAANS